MPWCFVSISSSASPFSFYLQSFPKSGSFPVSLIFTSGGQSFGTSASVLPMNIQGWFPVGVTGLISLLSRVFSSTTIQKHQFFGAQFSLWSNSHIHKELMEKVWKWKWKLLSWVWLFGIPWTVAHQAPPSMGFFKTRIWSGLPFPSPGDLPGPGIEPMSLSLWAGCLPSELPGKSHWKKYSFDYKDFCCQRSIQPKVSRPEHWSA